MMKLNKKDKWIAGVCGGLGREFRVNPNIFRIVTLCAAFCPYVPAVIIYLILWFFMAMNEDKEKE